MRKFRGMHPGTRIARWGLVAVALGIVLGSAGPSALEVVARAMATQHDALPWFASRVLGFIAYLAIVASVVYGLLLSTGILDAIAHRPISFALHQDLASVGVGLAGVHGALLGLDRVVPFSLAELAVPFASPYRPLWVAFGQLAFYLSAGVVGSFYVRRRIGQRAWRVLHSVTFVAFAGATSHGVMTGTDTGAPWAWVIYVGSAALVTFLFICRLALSVGRRRSSREAIRTGESRPLPLADRGTNSAA
jgi:predicted ferric reductase